MALPDNLADLFTSQHTLPAVQKPTSLANLPYRITWDALDDGTAPPELSAQLTGLYEAARQRPDRALAERLRRLVQQYPNVPALKNYLMITYTLTGQKSRADAVLEQTLQQHPDYLMGRVNRAHQLLVQHDLAGIEKLFCGPPTDLVTLYPERAVFQASEVAHFTHMAYTYACETGDPDTAENHLRLLRDLQYHTKEQLRTMKRQLDFARMKANMARMQEASDETVSVAGYFRAEDQQTTEPPVLENPEMAWLYEHGLIDTQKPLPADKRDALLALPRPSLTRDLSKVLLDTVYRYKHFLAQDWDETRHNFAGHALLLATQLRADECLEAVLDTLRQDYDFREFWWSDWLTDFYEPYCRRVLPAQADALRAFMQEPDINTYSKVTVSEAFAQEVLANPDLKPVAQTWYTGVLTFLIDHADDEHLFDTDLIAFVIGDVTSLQLTDLLPLIRTAYERDLVTESIHGDLAYIEQEMIERRYPADLRPIRTLAEQYEYLQNPAAYHKANANPDREQIGDDIPGESETQEDEWAFLYEDDEKENDDLPNGAVFPAQQRQWLSNQPVVKKPAPGRNDKVSVRYADGTIVQDVKYKKVEADVEAGKCALL